MTTQAPLPRRPELQSGRCDEIDSAAWYTSMCRSHDMTAFSAPTGQQHDPRPLRQPGPDRARPQHRLQPRTVALTQDQGRSNRHDSLSRTTNRKQSCDTRH